MAILVPADTSCGASVQSTEANDTSSGAYDTSSSTDDRSTEAIYQSSGVGDGATGQSIYRAAQMINQLKQSIDQVV